MVRRTGLRSLTVGTGS
jgi:transposase